VIHTERLGGGRAQTRSRIERATHFRRRQQLERCSTGIVIALDPYVTRGSGLRTTHSRTPGDVAVSAIRSRPELVLENAVLRHRVNVLRCGNKRLPTALATPIPTQKTPPLAHTAPLP
jgi:hypothetical protein